MIKKLGWVFILVLSFNSFAQTNYFVDSSNGNDNNNGLTEQSAWKTLGKIESTNFQPGDIIALKSGEIWYEDLYLTSSSGSAGNPITITSYGSGAKPIISVMEEQSLSWTNIGSNIWRSSTVNNHPSRIAVDGTERLSAALYSELGKSVPDLVEWHHESGQLYIYSSDSPANHTIEFSSTGTAVYLQNVDYLTISNIEVIGGYDFGIKAYSCDNLTLSNLTTGKYSKYTINIDAYEPQGGGSGYKIPKNLLIEDCIVDSNWNLDYSNSGKDQEHFQARGAYEGIRLNIVGSGVIRNNFIKNWMHAGLSLTSPATGDLSRPIRDVKIYGNTLTGDEVAYGSKVAFDRVAYNIEFYNNYLYDIPNENSFNGWDNHVHHNIFLRVKGTPLRTTNIGRAISVQGYAGEVYNNIYENNVMIDCDAAGMYISNSNNYDVHDNIFRNNIAYNCGINDSQYPNIGLLYKNGYASTYDNSFHNNIVYSTQTSTPYNFLYNIMDAAEFNTQTGSNSNISGNIQADPMFVNNQSDWHLLPDSPALDAAGPILAQFDYANNPIGANAEIGIYDGASNNTSPGSVTANAGQDVSICSGGSTTLTASGGSTYLWNTGATTPSITVSPTSTQTYTVTASDANGNSDSDDVIVTVNSVTANAGADVTIDEGQSTTLNASGGDSYLWNTGATSQSITVSPSSTQTYSVTVTQNGCDDTDDLIVTVNPTPGSVTANAGQDVSICSGGSTTLTASGGATYLWNTGATTNSITVSPNATQTYTVTASDANGNSDSDDVIVTVTSVTANAGADVTIDEGQSTTLNASGGDSYLWNTGATSQSITVSPTSTQTYSVTVTQNECDDTDDVIVTVNQTTASVTANAGSDVSICSGENTTLTASGGATYLWSTGATTTSITVSPNTTQTYTVTASDSNGNSDSDDVIVTVTSVTAYAGADVTIDEGQSTTLNASGGDSYVWNTGATSQSITVSPLSTQTYSVTVTQNGCDDSDDLIVTVNPSTGSVTANAGSDVSICSGENTTLTASGGTTYLWSTGATTNSVTVSPNATQTYTVTASDSNGNSDSDDVMVTVTTVTANAGADVTIDEGQSTTLNASGGDSYVWNTGATSQSITVSPLSTQTYSVTVSQNGCDDTDDVIVTVNQTTGSVTANAGSDVSICSGENTTLTASGGATYLWSTGATTNSITVSPNATQTYTVTASDSNGNSDSDDVMVTVTTVTANAGADVTIDEGQSTTLNASGGDSYLWNTGATSQSITVNPSSTETYSVTVSQKGCDDTDNVIVTVNQSTGPSPVSANAGQDATICVEESVILTAAGGDTYLWSTGETTNSITVSPTNTTIYTVTVSDGNSIDVDDVTVIVDETCSGISYRSTEKEAKLYPNPTKGILNIELANFSNESVISVYDLNGRKVYSKNIDNYSPVKIIKHQINLSNFGKGIYIVKLSNSNYREAKKIIVY